jgi:hypothetical protein
MSEMISIAEDIFENDEAENPDAQLEDTIERVRDLIGDDGVELLYGVKP